MSIASSSIKGNSLLKTIVATALLSTTATQAQTVEIGKILGQNKMTFNTREDVGNPLARFGSGSESQINRIYNSNYTLLFESSNNNILTNTNNIVESVIMNADGKGRKDVINLMNMSDGVYMHQSVHHESNNPVNNGIVTNVYFRKNGTNIEVLSVRQNSATNNRQKRTNRMQFSSASVNSQNNGVLASYSVPTIPADRSLSNEVSLDLDRVEQTGTQVMAEFTDMTSISSTTYTVDQAAGTITFNIPQSATTSISKLTTQHNGESGPIGNFGGTFPGLPAVNINGPMLGTAYNLLETDVSIYPNPTSDFLQITLPKGIIETHYEIYDLNNKLIDHGTINSEEKIDVQKLPEGTHIIQLTDKENNQNNTTKKFIKN